MQERNALDDQLNAIGRIHDVSPDTKVVMLSGSVSRGLVADAIAQGAQGFVGKEKPVGVTRFLPDSRMRHISSTSASSGA